MNLLYKTQIGSTLHGTSTPSSDTDYVGIYLPTKEQMLLETADHVINYDTNRTSTRNTADDIDYKIISLQHWLRLLAKGETNALDILFSMFQPATIEYENKAFTTYFKDLAPTLLTKSCKSFIGYANSQAKKYQLKTERYNELLIIIELLTEFDPHSKIGEHLGHLYSLDLEYVGVIVAPGPRKTINCHYLEILGRKHSEFNRISTVLEKLQQTERDYSNRAKNSNTPVEWKSLSHAVRIIDEIEELLLTNHITFPLTNSNYITRVKTAQEPIQDVLDYVTEKMLRVDQLITESTLPSTIAIEPHILHFY